jgi:hypothetical protein
LRVVVQLLSYSLIENAILQFHDCVLGLQVVLALNIHVLGIGFAQEYLIGVSLLKMILLWIQHFPLALLWSQRVVRGAVPLFVMVWAFGSFLELFQYRDF